MRTGIVLNHKGYSLFFLITFLLVYGHWEGKTAFAESEINKSSHLKINIGWEYKNFPLKMKMYEPGKKKRPRLWETENVKEMSLAPVSSIIEDGLLAIEPGSSKTFVLLLQNTTDRAIHFFAAPHNAYPSENALGFKFRCLCINHAFTIPPGEIWYRVVSLNVSPGFEGNSLQLTHTLVGIEKQRMEKFKLK